MNGLGNKDDELVAKIQNNIRVEERFAWSLMLTFAVISALFLGVLEFHLPMESTGIVAFAVLLAWIVLVFRNQGSVRHVGALHDEEILRRTIDDQHRRWRWIYIFVFIIVGGLAAMITAEILFLAGHLLTISAPPVAGYPQFLPGPMVSVLVVVLDFAFFAVVAALQVCFGPGFLKGAQRRALNDEHTRALQHSAAMFGYPLCVILMSVVLVIIIIRPQWGLMVMPGVIAAAVILPGLYFLIRQWRAGREA